MQDEHHQNKLIENTGTALAVAAGLEIVQGNAGRPESMWSRVGMFALNVLIGLGTLTLFDAVISRFSKKRAEKKAAAATQHVSQADDAHDAGHPGKTTWAKDIAEDKSCGCPYRS